MSDYKCYTCYDGGFKSKFEICDNCTAAYDYYEAYKAKAIEKELK